MGMLTLLPNMDALQCAAGSAAANKVVSGAHVLQRYVYGSKRVGGNAKSMKSSCCCLCCAHGSPLPRRVEQQCHTQRRQLLCRKLSCLLANTGAASATSASGIAWCWQAEVTPAPAAMVSVASY